MSIRFIQFYWFGFLWLLLLCACEEDQIVEPAGVIPERVRPYVDRFLWEAEKRGLNLDISQLSIEFEDNINISVAGDNQTVVGSCTRTGSRQLIQLDTLNSLWLLSGYLGKEEIVFHELGHCLLHREHRDDKFISGDFASIMRAVGLLQYGDLDNYTTLFTNPTGLKAHRRDYYVDELFNQNTSDPCWADSMTLPAFPVREFDGEFIRRRSWIDGENNFWLFGQGENYQFSAESGFVKVLSPIEITAMGNGPGQSVWASAISNEQNVIGTIESGNFRLKFSHEELPEALNTIEQLLIDDMGRIWISDRSGNLYVNEGEGFVQVDMQSQIRVTELRKGPENSVYLLKGGLFYIVRDAITFTQLGPENSELPVSLFRRLEVDGQGTAWLLPSGSPNFLLHFSPNFQVTRIYLNNVNLTDIRVNDITIDPLGTIWVATSNGIRKWQHHEFSKYCDYNTGLKILNFNSILVGSDETIWATGKDLASNQNRLLLAKPGA